MSLPIEKEGGKREEGRVARDGHTQAGHVSRPSCHVTRSNHGHITSLFVRQHASERRYKSACKCRTV